MSDQKKLPITQRMMYSRIYGKVIDTVDRRFSVSNVVYMCLNILETELCEGFDNELKKNDDKIKELEKKLSKYQKAIDDLGPWASAAQDDDKCCKELKGIFMELIDCTTESKS